MNKLKIICGGDDLSNKKFSVEDGDNESDIVKLIDVVQKEFNHEEIVRIEIDSIIGYHAGPGTIGVGVYDE